jgi:hypothetical protein
VRPLRGSQSLERNPLPVLREVMPNEYKLTNAITIKDAVMEVTDPNLLDDCKAALIARAERTCSAKCRKIAIEIEKRRIQLGRKK